MVILGAESPRKAGSAAVFWLAYREWTKCRTWTPFSPCANQISRAACLAQPSTFLYSLRGEHRRTSPFSSSSRPAASRGRPARTHRYLRRLPASLSRALGFLCVAFPRTRPVFVCVSGETGKVCGWLLQLSAQLCACAGAWFLGLALGMAAGRAVCTYLDGAHRLRPRFRLWPQISPRI